MKHYYRAGVKIAKAKHAFGLYSVYML